MYGIGEREEQLTQDTVHARVVLSYWKCQQEKKRTRMERRMSEVVWDFILTSLNLAEFFLKRFEVGQDWGQQPQGQLKFLSSILRDPSGRAHKIHDTVGMWWENYRDKLCGKWAHKKKGSRENNKQQKLRNFLRNPPLGTCHRNLL